MSRYVNEFSDWTGNRVVHCIGSNSRSDILPFQTWQHFKEAFAPELLKRAVEESEIPVHTCVDPFGGSGTTALACQFLGVEPTTIEINPYLGDLIEAKLASYNADALARDFGAILSQSRKTCDLKAWRIASHLLLFSQGGTRGGFSIVTLLTRCFASGWQ
ncbi:MAG: hypothetical protein JWQ49_5387 [Edaphobacter sp.]|nr:hypothetical protein [Edaphobacter sp.]